MSILNRLRLTAHLDDGALAAIWSEQSLDGTPMSHPHLQGCSTCRAKFDALAAWLEDIRVDANQEAGAVFTPERLAAQQAQIFRRLEAAERPARVIAFPKFAQPLSASSSHPSRWVAAAAAAGLIVGVGVGQLMDLRHPVPAPAVQTQAADTTRPDRTAVQPISASVNEEAFLSDLDATLARRSVAELRALDEFTPHAGERPR